MQGITFLRQCVCHLKKIFFFFFVEFARIETYSLLPKVRSNKTTNPSSVSRAVPFMKVRGQENSSAFGGWQSNSKFTGGGGVPSIQNPGDGVIKQEKSEFRIGVLCIQKWGGGWSKFSRDPLHFFRWNSLWKELLVLCLATFRNSTYLGQILHAT